MNEELSKQQKQVLTILQKKGSTTPKNLAEAYKNAHKQSIGNIHETLNRLIQNGLAKRLSQGNYTITVEGANLINKKSESVANTLYTKTEVEAFQKLAESPDFFKKISSIFAPNILGLENEKVACMLSMISQDDIDSDRHRINVLYTGEPGSGKSSIIKYAYKNLWGFFADSDASSAALKGTGTGYQTSTGLLKTADTSTLFLDELDKATKENQTALLGAMEQGFFTLNKDKVVNKKIDARVRCIATCNETGKLKPELLDRFDLIFDIQKLSKQEKQELLRLKINDWGRPKNGEETPEFLKKYLTYAKTVQTTLPEDREEITRMLITELDSGSLEGKDIRKLEAAIRVTVALAKLQLQTKVNTTHVKKSIQITQGEQR